MYTVEMKANADTKVGTRLHIFQLATLKSYLHIRGLYLYKRVFPLCLLCKPDLCNLFLFTCNPSFPHPTQAACATFGFFLVFTTTTSLVRVFILCFLQTDKAYCWTCLFAGLNTTLWVC